MEGSTIVAGLTLVADPALVAGTTVVADGAVSIEEGLVCVELVLGATLTLGAASVAGILPLGLVLGRAPRCAKHTVLNKPINIPARISFFMILSSTFLFPLPVKFGLLVRVEIDAARSLAMNHTNQGAPRVPKRTGRKQWTYFAGSGSTGK